MPDLAGMAVAELKELLIRTVAWLPAGMVAALAPNEAIKSASTTDMRNFITLSPSGVFCKKTPVRAIP